MTARVRWCLALLLVAVPAPAQTVTHVLVGKGTSFVQTSAAPPIVDPTPPGPQYGGPFSFEASVGGINLQGIAAPLVSVPGGSGILAPGMAPSYNGGVLGFN